jgi:hypothetical protein
MQHVEVPAPNIWLYYNTILVPLNITQEELESYDKERQKKLIEKEIKRILRVKGNITQVKTNIKEHGIEENIIYKTKKQTLAIKLLYTQDNNKTPARTGMKANMKDAEVRSRCYMYALLIILLGGFLSENVLEKIEEIGRKLDKLKDFLEDVFLTTEEYILLKEVDDIVKNKRFSELKSLNEV